METTDYQNKLMQHTCGINKSPPEDRNWFGTSQGKDAAEFDKLVVMGLAIRRDAPKWAGNTWSYHLTEEGRKVAYDTLPEPEPIKKLTRSQQNYQDYLHSECSETFAEWMGFD